MHDCIARALTDAGVANEFLYGFDDYDAMDGLPPDLPQFAQYMGKPLADIPSPDGCAPSYGHYFAAEFAGVFERLGARPRLYRTSEMYRSGAFDDAIRIALDHAPEIREIYRELTHSARVDDRWWPIQVLCERCGRIGTTSVLAWAGDEVTYECAADKVTWAEGCGYRGRRPPFAGGSKLLYRVEWPAKWAILGVTVEGAGKDHMTRGGTHDVALAISTRIFRRPAPYSFSYEFLLYGGKKMSTSRAVGATAAEILDVLRPELARFLIVRPLPRRQLEFDPRGETIPMLYDEYDRAAAAYFHEIDMPDLARTFHYAKVSGDPVPAYRPRFSKVAYLLQMPAVDLPRMIAREKGAPLTEADREELERRIADARRWLAIYAPEHYKFEVHASLPPSVSSLTRAQRQYLARIAEGLGSHVWTGEALHAHLHELKNELTLSPREAFGAIYQAFLGKDSGPQAGWFLTALDRAFVLQRLREAAQDAA